MKYLYRIYLVCVAAPLIIILTILTTIVIAIGMSIGNGHWFGYYPGKIWAWLIYTPSASSSSAKRFSQPLRSSSVKLTMHGLSMK